MIQVRCVGGPYDGVVRTPPADMRPAILLFDMVELGWAWEIDFSQATRDEAIAWGRADLAVRAYRAVRNGRPVIFLGVEYTSVGELQVFEDAIVNSGYSIKVASDDQNGLVVDIVQPE